MSRWSARSEARTNDLDNGEDRPTIEARREAASSRSSAESSSLRSADRSSTIAAGNSSMALGLDGRAVITVALRTTAARMADVRPRTPDPNLAGPFGGDRGSGRGEKGIEAGSQSEAINGLTGIEQRPGVPKAPHHDVVSDRLEEERTKIHFLIAQRRRGNKILQ